MADFQELEKSDAVRMTWNIWPNSRVEATKCVVPFSALYTPNKVLEHMPVVQYEPVPCKGCGAILNPLAFVDYASRVWTCCMCHNRNSFPSHYHGITPEQPPAELYGQYQTIEYQIQFPKPVSPPAYIFVVDTCVVEEELSACKAAITKALQTLPEWAHVGLVTYGTHVHVHELGFAECAKSYVFQGSRDYAAQQVADQLGLGKASRQTQAPGLQQPQQLPGKRFIPQLGDCEFTITGHRLEGHIDRNVGVLDELQRDAFPAIAEHRPARCTGTALQVAASLMGAALTGTTCAARLMLFVGGPSTTGGGKIVETELTEAIRSHKDLVKDAAPFFRKARKFFEGLAKQLVAQGHALDVFACSLDQVGLAEMKVPVEATGGLVVQTDTFHNPVFKESLKRMFGRPDDPQSLALASNATFEVIPTRIDGEVKVSGVLGAAAPLEKKGPGVGDQVVGMGGTTIWKLASLDPSTTLAVFFEVGSSGKEKAVSSPQFYMQFLTKYLHADGSARVRVTTISRSWTEGNNAQSLISGFDQEAAAVVVARLASHKMETEEDFDATRWLDRTLIRLTSRFGDYRKDDAESFQLAPQMSFFPQFMFNLRRSQFVQVFGNSPDETAYSRLVLNKETTPEALTAIQPMLMAYSFEAPATPVLLDVSSIQPDRILLLDSYFHVVVFHGSTVAQWRKAGYHQQEEHAAFKQLLQGPMEEAAAIVRRRFPVPRLVDCDQNGSQARFLTAKLNPSATHSTVGAQSSEIILTDDVSLNGFTEHLKKLAVQS